MSRIVVKNTHRSIQKQIENNITKSTHAIGEFIWNAIDALAKNIDIEISLAEGALKGTIESISIIDDGRGIIFEELEEETFGVFNDSEKEEKHENNQTLPHGKNGYGRLSFIKFCKHAVWETTYQKANEFYFYKIKINSDKLNVCLIDDTAQKSEYKKTGTKVIFSSFIDNNHLVNLNSKDKFSDLIKYIKGEFGWIIELFNLNIKINGVKIEIKDIIRNKIYQLDKKISSYSFNIKICFWKESFQNEPSRYYFLNSTLSESCTRRVTQDKLDNFPVSIYIQSSFFDKFIKCYLRKTPDQKLDTKDEIFLELIEFIEKYLCSLADEFIEDLVENKFSIISNKKYYSELFKTEIEEKVKKPLFEQATKTLIKASPEIFKSKNDLQNKIITNLIYESLDSEESRDSLINILKLLVDESNKDSIIEFEKQLKTYGLKNILSTIKLIEKRFFVLKCFEKVINENSFYFLESDLQKLIEKNFWIFGEEYHLIGAENDRFGKLLEIYYEQILELDSAAIHKIKTSKKEVDLMISRKDWYGQDIHNTIVEIKKPKKPLTSKNLEQIKKYARIVSEIDGFNSNGEQWGYILIGESYENEVIQEIENKSSLKEGLYFEAKNYKIFVKKWSDILNHVKFSLEYLKKELGIKERELMKNIDKNILMAKDDKQSFLDTIPELN